MKLVDCLHFNNNKAGITRSPSIKKIVPPNQNSSTWIEFLARFKLWKLLINILLFGLLLYIYLFLISTPMIRDQIENKSSTTSPITIVLNTFQRHDFMKGYLILISLIYD
jgi:hypothetical protein